ncbi:MAG: 16S rRNA (adenine(1518)-N(6)/adenine(1519)-N(6))-dimethyltransferase RsmA [Acutalibacteraceae bacterium]|nr:16S rRNA (adenine(1518)-N(6)/adenine(1519)-N(6))-dimethyltransferase RsmA [Acutalibacteraceae bacterium]
MELSNIGNIKEILGKHGFTFSKSLGQNFLVNPSVCPRMAEYSGADKGVGVIEVGPGIGVLTCELAKRADKVVSVELDKRLLPVLDETLSEFDNIKIVNDDILKIDLNKLIADEFEGMKVVVCANLPYYITSPVIMKLLEDKLPIKALTVMVQKEAAQRICAEVGTRQSGAVTVAVNYYAKPQMLFGVSAGSFMPAPKVDSAVIRLDILEKPSVTVENEKLFFKIIKSAFGQRRKTLPNSLSSGLSISKTEAITAMDNANIPQNYRAEQLTMEQFASIANEMERLNNTKTKA